jgi:hypothetical protein
VSVSNTTTQLVHAPQVTDITEEDNGNRLFLKVFLLDDSINAAKWRIKSDSIAKHIEKFVGRPFILTKEHYHPIEFEQVPIDYQDTNNTVGRLLQAQEKYRIGTIRKVERSLNPSQAAYGTTWNAYVEITDKAAVEAARKGFIPRYVSASVFRLNPNESPQETTDYEPLHLASVDHPAYGIHKAGVRGSCNGDLIRCSAQLAQASSLINSDVYSSLVNSNTSERLVNLTDNNAEHQQQQPTTVTPSNQTGTTAAATSDNNVVAANPSPTQSQSLPPQPTQLPQQPQQQQQQPQQQLRQITGNTAPFEVQKVEPTTKQAEQQQQPLQPQNLVQEMAKLMTNYEALLHEVNDLKTFKQTAQQTEEQNRTQIKKSKIESAIPADYADSPEERTKAIDSLMKLSDGPELDYVLQRFVTPVANISPCALAKMQTEQAEQKGVEQAAAANGKKDKASFMRAKRVTDYASTSSSNNNNNRQVKKPAAVAQAAAATDGGNNNNTIDLNRLRRICSMTDIVSNTSFEGGRF